MSDVREQTGGDDVLVTDPVETSTDPVETSTDPVETSTHTAEASETEVPERSARETRVRGAGRTETDGTDDQVAGAVDEEAGDDSDDEDDDPENTLEGEAEIAADYLEELLDIADLDGDIDTYIEGDRAHVSIVTESEVLVGERGAVLDALQELTRLAVMTETGDRSRLMLDVAGFRDRRRQELLRMAAAAVEEARAQKVAVPLAAMNPFERKIVHDAVASAGLSSESEGDEPNRHVVVQPSA